MTLGSTKLPRLVVFVESHQLSLYSDEMAEIQVIPFNGAMVKDMEVVGQDALQAQVDTWLKQLAFQPHTILFVLASTLYFKKEFPEKTEKDPEVAKFFELVPLESSTAKVFQFNEITVAVATNNDFYQPLVEVFKKQKCEIEGMTPGFVFAQVPDQPLQFTPEAARQILSEWDTALKYSLVAKMTTTKKSEGTGAENAKSKTTGTNASMPPSEGDGKLFGLPRVFVLGGAFAVLLLIMLIYFFTQKEALGL